MLHALLALSATKTSAARRALMQVVSDLFVHGGAGDVATPTAEDVADAEAMVDLVREGIRHLDGCLDDMTAAGRPVALALLLAGLADLPETQVARVLFRSEELGIAVLCRHLDVGEMSYRRLALLRCRRHGRPPADVEAMLADYRRIDRATADRLLRFHRVRITVTTE